jgi:hypothetical protein
MGFCAFVALMCSGFAWLLGVCGVTWGFLGTLSWLANIGLSVCAFLAGWVWICSSVKPGTFRIVLQVLFVIFAILAIFGVINGHLGWI